MATADSIIRVSIIGDAKKLTGAIDKADGGVKGFVKKAGLAVGGLVAVDQAFDFVKGALEQTDRMGDAVGRLQGQIGEVDTKKIEDVAGNFHTLGLSAPDVLDLSAAFADIATSAGIAAPDIAKAAPEMAGLAAAIQLAGGDAGKSVDDIIRDIGKAAAGSDKPLRDLGIHLDDAAVAQQAMLDTGKTLPSQLTDSEKATARLELITADLRDRFGETAGKTGDLEQSQADLQAQVETLQAKLGGPLSDALKNVVDFILDEIDAIPHAIDGWASLGRAIGDFAAFAATPLANVHDALSGIVDLLFKVNGSIPTTAGQSDSTRRRNPGGRPVSDSGTVRAVQRVTERKGGIGNSLGGP